jgi:hypothetical protein
VNIAQEMPSKDNRQALWLTAYVTSCALGGLLLYLSGRFGIMRVVSWSITPGLPVLAAILGCGFFVVIRGERISHAVLGCCLLCAPMFLDFVGLRTDIFVLIGVALTVVACSYIYLAVPASRVGRFGFWAIGAYIHSTFISNALYVGYGHMSFFGASYTR